MPRLIKNFISRLKLFSPVFIGIGVSVLIITWQSISNTRETIHESLKESISTELETITKMFERERKLKLEMVKTHLKIMHNYFYSAEFRIENSNKTVNAINQVSGASHKVKLNNWVLNNSSILDNHSFVDSIQKLFGGTATVFQEIDSGYIRVSTNVMTKDANRAIGTYIPNNSQVITAIEKGDSYIGRAFVVNDWYITAYEPIFHKAKVVGILYVGDKEKNLTELGKTISNIKLGKSGYVVVADEFGKIIVQAKTQKRALLDSIIYRYVTKAKKGVFDNEENGQLIAFDYFEGFHLYVLATINLKTETNKLIKKIILESIVIGFVIMILLSAFVYFITTENIHKYLRQLNLSNRNLASTRKALNFSEQKFETIFNNSSDEIFLADLSGNFVEVNQLVCEELGYTKDELLNMGFLDIRSQKYRPYVSKNLKQIISKGFHTYETENMAKSGKIITVEMKSRLIDCSGTKMIISMARNVTERKAMEKKVMSTILKTEEKERKRFATDLHDNLGPILSTIKLYSDLIKKGDNKKLDLNEAIINIDELTDMAISTTKEISNNITPTILHDFGLATAIREFCNYVNSTKSVNIQVKTDAYELKTRGIFETILFQTTKELINNTLKHAHAENVTIELKNNKNQVILYFKDDGVGFDSEKMLKESTGLGLNSIIGKLKTLKASYDINSSKGNGMFILISVKLEEPSVEPGADTSA